MESFWFLARRLLRYRALLAAGALCALVSVGGIGVGFVAMKPVLDSLVADEPMGLAQLGAMVNEELPAPLDIPQAWLEAAPEGPFTALAILIGLLGILTIVGGTGQFLHAYLSLTVVHRTVTGIRREAFHRVLRLPLASVVAGGSSDIISRVVNDTTALGHGFNALISKAVLKAGRGAIGLLVALYYHWVLTCIALLVAPLLYTLIRRLGTRIRRASRRALEKQSLLYGSAAEALGALRVVKVHTTERYEAGRFHRENKEVLRQLMRVRTARALASPLVEVLSLLIIGALMLIAMKAIVIGRLEPTRFALVLGALGLAAGSLKPLTGLLNDIQSSAGAADRVRSLLESKPEAGHDSALAKLPRHEESIEIERVTFNYPGTEAPALDDVSLRIEHGRTVAIVGPNGSGKTTLLAMVPRLFDPTHGRVLIDGRDIREHSVRSVRRQVGMVTQEVIIFAGSILDNIAYGAEGATRRRVIEAARRARAHTFVEQLPDGYDTIVGEQGATLSGGQRQRIAIARAILREPAILILDEATSMIDAESEAMIGEAIAEFSRGRTCLIVAHRLSTILGAHHIVVMDKGRIVDEGAHDELLERSPVYQTIAQRQLSPRPRQPV